MTTKKNEKNSLGLVVKGKSQGMDKERQSEETHIQQLQWQRIMAISHDMKEAAEHRRWPKFKQLLTLQQEALTEFFANTPISPQLLDTLRQDMTILITRNQTWSQQALAQKEQLGQQLQQLSQTQKGIKLYQDHESH